MIKTFTYDDVIRYVYSETTPEENECIQNALVVDDHLMSFYIDLLGITGEMDKIKRVPSERTVHSIIEYSRYQNAILAPSGS